MKAQESLSAPQGFGFPLKPRVILVLLFCALNDTGSSVLIEACQDMKPLTDGLKAMIKERGFTFFVNYFGTHLTFT